MKCVLAFLLVLYAFFASTTVLAQVGSSCETARTTLRGDYWLAPGQSIWFTGGYNSVSEGISCFWFSQDTLFVDAYYALPYVTSECPGNYIKVFRALPNGIMEITPEFLNEKIREKSLEYLGMEPTPQLLALITINLHIYARNGLPGRLFINDLGVAPQSSAAGPFQATEYQNYLVNKQTNAYYQITWDKTDKPDSIYVFWQPRDSAEDFRADLHNNYPTIQFRRQNNAGEPKGVATRVAGGNRYYLKQPAYDVAVSDQDSLFVTIMNAPEDGYFKFCGLYLNSQNFTSEICQGQQLCLNNGCYGQSGQYRDTTGNDFWHRNYNDYNLTVLPPVMSEDIKEVTVRQLPVEYEGHNLETEGLHDVLFKTLEGCDSIQRVRVIVETALNNTRESSLEIEPGQPQAGQLMKIKADTGQDVIVLDMQGRVVMAAKTGKSFTAPQQGIYLIKTAKEVKKIKIK